MLGIIIGLFLVIGLEYRSIKTGWHDVLRLHSVSNRYEYDEPFRAGDSVYFGNDTFYITSFKELNSVRINGMHKFSR